MSTTTPVVTRFAPSPTGFLHIGGARTALFNWLYARRHGGHFLLRIEDTDRARSTVEAIDAILDGLTWLGLVPDCPPIYQSQRADRHREVARMLLEQGQAYRCYASPEELAQMRERALAEGRTPRYDGRWRDRDPKDAPAGVTPAIRLKAPQTGETVIDDLVQGPVRFGNDQLDDLVLLRADGTPTYMLAVVADDHDMGITHVIRGDDHLVNAARQTLIYKALGWDSPAFGHVPLIHGPDGAKLSKRHGALGVEAYREMGYLPEALANYLLRLGWGHGDDEIFSLDQVIQWFDIRDVNKGAARMDYAKLDHVNGHYIRAADPERLVTEVRSRLAQTLGRAVPDEEAGRIGRCMDPLRERAKTLNDLAEKARFLVDERPLTLDEKAAKLMTAESRALLTGLNARLTALNAWTPERIDAEIRDFAAEAGVKFGQVAQPLRAALTGTTQAPGILEILIALGQAESIARISDQAP